jgi:hypothetical protein
LAGLRTLGFCFKARQPNAAARSSPLGLSLESQRFAKSSAADNQIDQGRGGSDRAGATKNPNGFIAMPALPSCAAQPTSKYARDARERSRPERDDHERFIKVRIQPTSIPLGRIPKFSPVSGSI